MRSIRSLVFSDVEGSTALLEQAADRYSRLLQIHRAVVREEMQRVGGREHGTEGDSFFLSFDTPLAAIAASVAIQGRLEAIEWPDGLRVRIRIGIHVGEVLEEAQDLIGLAVNHAARIASCAHGGQIVVSHAARVMAVPLPEGTTIEPLGPHGLRDVGIVELFQVHGAGMQRVFPSLRYATANRRNLPRPATTFIGGTEVLSMMDQLVKISSVLTLTGAGGIGKTRAALEWAWRHLDVFVDGAFFVDLAPSADNDTVAEALVAALPVVPPRDETSPASTLIVDWLRDRRVLLIFDNCEHVVDGAARLVGTIVASCRSVSVIATSREPLRIAGEHVLLVPSLSPDGDAVELFIERATQADASFAIAGDGGAIASVCERLDGIPLALELAASRMRSMSPIELLERLDDVFRLLQGRGRGTLDRHETLLATISWSYGLLSREEQLCFDRLSVFAGGFSLASAEAVCCSAGIEAGDVVDLLRSLVEKSMLVGLRSTAGHRFRLLETLRQYAERQLGERGETAIIRNRHLQHFVELVPQVERQFFSDSEAQADHRFSVEWDNVRTAVSWALSSSQMASAQQLIDRTFQFAGAHMRHEHAVWVAAVWEAEQIAGTPRIRTLSLLADWASVGGDETTARKHAQHGINIASKPDDSDLVTCWMMFAGPSAITASQSAEAQHAFQQLQACANNVPDLDAEPWIALCLLAAARWADPSWVPHYRQVLKGTVERIRNPSMQLFWAMEEGDKCILADPPEIAAAMHYFRAAREAAMAVGQEYGEGLALRRVAMVAAMQGGADALEWSRVALETLAESQLWDVMWRLLDSVSLALAAHGRTDAAATILGSLGDRPPLGLEAELNIRATALAIVNAAGEHLADFARGALMTPREVLSAAIESCRP